MGRTKNELIIDGLSGNPIEDLVDGWTFRIHEVSPYVFKAEARDSVGRCALGAGGSAEEALDNCLYRVERKVRIRKFLKFWLAK